MLVFLIVILLLAALLEFLSLRGGTDRVDASFSLSKTRAETGESVEFTTVVRNCAHYPISYCRLTIAIPTSAHFPENADVRQDLNLCTLNDVYRLWGRQSKERRLSFHMEKRGVYVFSGREIYRGDFLGFHLASDHFNMLRTILVYPPRLSSAALIDSLGSYCGELSAQRWLIRDPVLTIGVREYTGNEPMRTISWSQTARRGELTVREFDYTRSLNCQVLFSVHGLTPNDGALLDRCCSAVRTICETLISAGVEAQLYTNASLSGFPNQPYRTVTAGPNREEDLLDLLARATYLCCSSASVLAEECICAQSEASAYVLVTPHADAKTYNALHLLESRSGMGVMLVSVDQLEVD